MKNIFSGFGKDPKKSKFELHATLDRLEAVGDYKITGSVIILPMVGNGIANLTFGMTAFKRC